MGPLWIDISGYELDAEDREILQHPTVGGLILFARNFHDNEQLLALCNEIRKVSKHRLLIGVDQEGGLVQRFRNGFTPIPAAQSFSQLENGTQLAQQAGWLMAAELIAHNIDLSFAPVLDKGHECKAIRSRAFGEDIQTILTYSSAYMKGMKQVGMATTGKHFPGHGGVIADSHLETPYDNRNNIFETDMAIFKSQIESGILDAMMPAHVIYPHYDSEPASGSTYWLKDILRKKLGFSGVVFSDDLNMEGASIMGSAAERAKQALAAGCDMLLLCNNRNRSVEILDSLPITTSLVGESLAKKQSFTLSELKLSREWKDASEAMKRVIG
ncbi:beta-N-acetylhexosaminidase [Vibrio algarum]|uniref:Beta-hexosaminidase n=1 Tax=Vibrio algarum TaxID=3020714 RepID=A0ABT4YNV7_9VIBR|nr:beta-N-acetylhexosaminidase [Vibrio sp. KJ40-1]MDB1123075.1 beta-N-acetylhexosaminidase [Vibrio sp. KJ40-1]